MPSIAIPDTGAEYATPKVVAELLGIDPRVVRRILKKDRDTTPAPIVDHIVDRNGRPAAYHVITAVALLLYGQPITRFPVARERIIEHGCDLEAYNTSLTNAVCARMRQIDGISGYGDQEIIDAWRNPPVGEEEAR